MTRAWKAVFGGTVVLLVTSWVALGVTIWRAKTVVTTADTAL